MRVLLTAVIFATSMMATAQDKKKSPKKEEEIPDLVFTKISYDAETDMKQWNRYIRKNFPIPDSSQVTNLSVVVTFIVDRYGRMTDIKVDKDPGNGLGRRIEKVVKDYPGAWKPAIQCGVAVNSYKSIPITICLERD